MIYYALAVAFIIRSMEYVVSYTSLERVFDARGMTRHLLCAVGGLWAVLEGDLPWYWALTIALVADLALICRELLDVVVDLCRVHVLSRRARSR